MSKENMLFDDYNPGQCDPYITSFIDVKRIDPDLRRHLRHPGKATLPKAKKLDFNLPVFVCFFPTEMDDNGVLRSAIERIARIINSATCLNVVKASNYVFENIDKFELRNVSGRGSILLFERDKYSRKIKEKGDLSWVDIIDAKYEVDIVNYMLKLYDICVRQS